MLLELILLRITPAVNTTFHLRASPKPHHQDLPQRPNEIKRYLQGMWFSSCWLNRLHLRQNGPLFLAIRKSSNLKLQVAFRRVLKWRWSDYNPVIILLADNRPLKWCGWFWQIKTNVGEPCIDHNVEIRQRPNLIQQTNHHMISFMLFVLFLINCLKNE